MTDPIWNYLRTLTPDADPDVIRGFWDGLARALGHRVDERPEPVCGDLL